MRHMVTVFICNEIPSDKTLISK